MKKIFALILALVMLLTSLSACGKKADTSTADAYLSMAQDFLDKNDYNSAIDILNKGFAETKDSRLSEKLVEIYAQRDNTETTEPSSVETQATTAPATKPTATTPPTTKPAPTTPPTTKPAATKAPTTKATTPPTTKPAATKAPTTASQTTSSNVTPEFKKAMDSYEKFFNEYVDFMNAYAKSDNAFSMLDDYLDFMQQYTDTIQKLSAIETQKLSAVDYAYYIEVNGRITKKLLEVVTTPSAPSSTDDKSEQNTESKTNRYAAAVAEAIKQANRWFPSDRHFIEYILVNPSLEEGFDSYTEEEAAYAIANADIDWKKHALHTAKEVLETDPDISQRDMRYFVEASGGYCECAGYTDAEIQYAVDNCGIDWKSQAINVIRNYWNNDYNVIFTLYDFYDCLEMLGYDDDTIQYALDNTSGYYRGETTATEEERVKLLLSYGYTREAIIDWYSKIMDYSEAEALVDSCL